MNAATPIPPPMTDSALAQQPGRYSIIAVSVGPGRDYCAILLEGREIARADISDYNTMASAVAFMNEHGDEMPSMHGIFIVKEREFEPCQTCIERQR